ncbi:hypothetical protein NEUTE2DRAFT_124630 [Neurospora tetrasperma FGSC 2509]|nr:hypothetical protein NEUTE2DRAFT_124630 [Neurospora tetrasperma FGSC 2509]
MYLIGELKNSVNGFVMETVRLRAIQQAATIEGWAVVRRGRNLNIRNISVRSSDIAAILASDPETRDRFHDGCVNTFLFILKASSRTGLIVSSRPRVKFPGFALNLPFSMLITSTSDSVNAFPIRAGPFILSL